MGWLSLEERTLSYWRVSRAYQGLTQMGTGNALRLLGHIACYTSGQRLIHLSLNMRRDIIDGKPSQRSA